MGSKLLTIKGSNAEMTANFLRLLQSKYFMTEQKIIKVVVGKRETYLITWEMIEYKVYQKINAPTYILSFPMEVSTRLSSCNCIKQETITFGFYVRAT